MLDIISGRTEIEISFAKRPPKANRNQGYFLAIFPTINSNRCGTSRVSNDIKMRLLYKKLPLRWLPTIICGITKGEIYDRITVPRSAELI